MKKIKDYLIGFLALGAICSIGADTSIDWRPNGWPVFTHRTTSNPSRTIEFGLRSDGVVVWREITQAWPRTNSPAELPLPVITNLYRSPGMPTNASYVPYQATAPIEGMSTHNPLDPLMTPPLPVQ